MAETAMQHDTHMLVDEGRTESLGVDVAERASPSGLDARLRAARAEITQPGCYLIYEGVGCEPAVFTVDVDIVRIGRSLNADIRFEDPTVARHGRKQRCSTTRTCWWTKGVLSRLASM